MSMLLRITFFLTTLTLASCSTIGAHFPFVYSITVDQGNIIDQDMINQLRPDMNKRQVLYIMGGPMLTDIFHQNRWDYIYSVQPDGGERLQKRVALLFSGDKLMGVQGDFRPSSLPVIRASREETVDVPKRDLEKTFFEKIAGLFSSDDSENDSAPTDSDEASGTENETNSEKAPATDDEQEVSVTADEDAATTALETQDISVETDALDESGMPDESSVSESIETDQAAEQLKPAAPDYLDQDTEKILLEKDDRLILPDPEE